MMVSKVDFVLNMVDQFKVCERRILYRHGCFLFFAIERKNPSDFIAAFVGREGSDQTEHPEVESEGEQRHQSTNQNF